MIAALIARIVSMNQSFIDMIQSIAGIIYNITSDNFPDKDVNIVHSYVKNRLSMSKKLQSQYARYIWKLA